LLSNPPNQPCYPVNQKARINPGIGAGFIPAVLNTRIYDEIVQVSTEDALKTARLMPKLEGLLVGISSGAAVWAALSIAHRPENKGNYLSQLSHPLVNDI